MDVSTNGSQVAAQGIFQNHVRYWKYVRASSVGTAGLRAALPYGPLHLFETKSNDTSRSEVLP
jgi:hypothetical protein